MRIDKVTYLALQADPATHLIAGNTFVGVGVECLARGLVFELTIGVSINDQNMTSSVTYLIVFTQPFIAE
jgi:hypothetical protein